MPNLQNRIARLEGALSTSSYGAVILMEMDETTVDARARHVAEHGEFEGEAVFIEIMGAREGHA